MRDVDRLDVSLAIRAAQALARVGVTDHSHSVPNQLAGVKRVADDPVASTGGAVDRAGVPRDAPRRGNAVRVEPSGNLPRQASRNQFIEYATNHLRFALMDLHDARLARHSAIAVGTPSGVAPVVDDACHASTGLILEVGQEERRYQPAYPDLDIVGLPVVDGNDLHPRKRQALVHPGKILLVAGQPV
ncbi:hypothetical protein PR017_23670 (plasmid) [Rhizobium tumorigenes]|uniref:Uncharacterized protein n=1 Tax=Rhizobium tumorigenes TaxID=2041385 RepID=A0AAF1KNY7_9HYPH|nr:hypothetical protein [Rhizobium tumorigenes]WFR98703.1 hypothetical protein PR017_23670 [Rhizobium tumorigenes]